MVVPRDDPALSPEANALRRSAGRLNHLGTIFAGGLAELGRGQALTLIPDDAPGLKTVRDLLQMILFTRAEINAVTKVLEEKGIVSGEEMAGLVADEYDWFANAKAEQYGATVTNQGLEWKFGSAGLRRGAPKEGAQ